MIITPATIAAPQGLPPGAAEFLKLRTERSATYLNADGSRTWVGGLDALHYKEDYADPSRPWLAVDPSHYVETKEYRLYDRLPALVTVWKGRVGYEVESRVTPGHRFRVELVAVDGAEKSAWTDGDALSFECRIGPGEVRLWKHLSGKDAPKRFTWRIIEEGSGPLTFREAPEAVAKADGRAVAVAVKRTDLASVDGLRQFLWEEEVAESDCSIDTDVTYQVGAAADDGYISGGTFYSSQNMDYFGQGTYAMSAFHRFTGVAIPVGATIVTAKARFCAYGGTGTTCNANVYFNAADNASAPTSYSDYTGKAVTAAVAWNAIGGWTTGVWYYSPELKTILQAVIDRAGWSSGNAVMVLTKNNGSSASAYRGIWSRDYGAAYGAKLIVTYDPPGQPTMRRWQGVNFMRVR